MPDAVLEIAGLRYSYPGGGTPALDGIDLRLAEGELCVVCGRSGSGKSTLLRAACGLVPHFHGGELGGSVWVAGLDVREHGPGELAREVALVAQDAEAQVVSTTVRAELELPLELRGDRSAGRGRAVEEAALALAIPHLLERATDSLSGGELQRVAIASALVSRPRLVLLDEPTSQLDPVAADELLALLRRLNEEWGTAIVLCEHRLERCLTGADRAVAFADGRIAFDGPPPAFLEWAVEADPALATPGARLFHLAGRRPLPVGVKDARRMLGDGATRREGGPPPQEPESRRWGRRQEHPPGAALRVRDLWVELEDEGGVRDAVRGIDLRLEPGERLALMGRNGAGKSTLLRCVAGLVKPARGTAEAGGEVCLLSQRPDDYLVHERVRDELPGEAGRLALAAVGLEGCSERDPRDLSGGERQRLALAIALAGREDPACVLLDEPTRGMDRAAKERLRETCAGLADAGAAVLVATHDVEFAARFAQRVVLLGAGEVIADGPVGQLLDGGWYFATEVARILPGSGALVPEDAVSLLAPPVGADA